MSEQGDLNSVENSPTERDIKLIQLKTPMRVYERMREGAINEGFTTLSSFIRFKCLNRSFDEKLNEVLKNQKIILARIGVKDE